jgi:hypothetical protein
MTRRSRIDSDKLNRQTRILLAETSPGAVEVRLTGMILLLLTVCWAIFANPAIFH